MTVENQAFQFDAQLSSLSAMKVCEHYKGIHGEIMPFSCKSLADFCKVNSSTASTAGTKAGVKFTRTVSSPASLQGNAPTAIEVAVAVEEGIPASIIEAFDCLATIGYRSDMPSLDDVDGIKQWYRDIHAGIHAGSIDKVFSMMTSKVNEKDWSRIGIETVAMKTARIDRLAKATAEQRKLLEGTGHVVLAPWNDNVQGFLGDLAAIPKGLRSRVIRRMNALDRSEGIFAARKAREEAEQAALNNHLVVTVTASAEMDATAELAKLKEEMRIANERTAKLLAELEASKAKEAATLSATPSPRKGKGNGQSATT